MATSDSEAFESADEDFGDSDTKPSSASEKVSKKSGKKAADKNNVENNDDLTKSDNDKSATKEQKKKDRPQRKPVERKPKQASKLGVKVANKVAADVELKKVEETPSSSTQKMEPKKTVDDEDLSDDEWNNFDIEDPKSEEVEKVVVADKKIEQDVKKAKNQEDEGWDDGFGDWEDDEIEADNVKMDNVKENTAAIPNTVHSEKEYKELADRLSALGGGSGKVETPSSSGWGGWGDWGANLLSSGVSQLTSHVTQGLSTVTNVIESGMGAPDPEELVRLQKAARERREEEMKTESSVQKSVESIEKEKNKSSQQSPTEESGQEEDVLGVFKLGKIVSSVTKLVETTGTAVVSGGLDTLEEIGKRTMRVIQGDEPGGRIKLSTLLREAKEKADERPPTSSEGDKPQGKKVPRFEALFDDYQGLVHIEALEMLSKQCDMKIQSLLNNCHGKELSELKETLNQVKDICELPDPEEEDDIEGKLDVETFQSKLQEATKDLGLQLNFEAVVNCWEEILNETNKPIEPVEGDDSEAKQKVENMAEDLSHSAITNLARCSALSVQLLHKSTALLSVKERRSTADEADGLTQLTMVLSSHIGEVAAVYSQKLNQMAQMCGNSEKTNTFITSVFLEAGKGSSYVQDAFLLTIPILQVGAT